MDPILDAMADRARIAIVGCGDVAYRHYVPGLASRAPDVEIAAVVDPRPGAAEALASAVASGSPGTSRRTKKVKVATAHNTTGSQINRRKI